MPDSAHPHHLSTLNSFWTTSSDGLPNATTSSAQGLHGPSKGRTCCKLSSRCTVQSLGMHRYAATFAFPQHGKWIKKTDKFGRALNLAIVDSRYEKWCFWRLSLEAGNSLYANQKRLFTIAVAPTPQLHSETPEQSAPCCRQTNWCLVRLHVGAGAGKHSPMHRTIHPGHSVVC